MKIASETPLSELLPPQPSPRGSSDHDAAMSGSEIVHLCLSNQKALIGIVTANGMAGLVHLGDKVWPATRIRSLLTLMSHP